MAPLMSLRCAPPLPRLAVKRRSATAQGAGSAHQPLRATASAGAEGQADLDTRRNVLRLAAGVAAGGSLRAQEAHALGFKKDLKPARLRKIPDSEFIELPSGIKYYDVKVGDGLLAQQGSRVAVHYDCKWRGITFMTSRQGMGVTGGTPMGFDVGAKGSGGTLEGLDLGVRGMRVGGQRKLKVPPEYGYGNQQIGEIPPGSTLDIDVELLSIKTSPYGSRVKLIEG